MGELTLKFGEAATRHLKSLPSPSGAVVLRDPIRDHVSQDGDKSNAPPFRCSCGVRVALLTEVWPLSPIRCWVSSPHCLKGHARSTAVLESCVGTRHREHHKCATVVVQVSAMDCCLVPTFERFCVGFLVRGQQKCSRLARSYRCWGDASVPSGSLLFARAVVLPNAPPCSSDVHVCVAGASWGVVALR
jgi:hypothetical protein